MSGSSGGGLSQPEKLAIGLVENTSAWNSVDHGMLAAQASALLSRFGGVSAANLARIMLSAALGLETALSTSDDPDIQVAASQAFCVELQMLAAAVTRKERGLPPIGVNGSSPEEKEEENGSGGSDGGSSGEHAGEA